MAPVARLNHANPRVTLNLRDCKHGIGNKGVVLRRNDERRDRNSVDYKGCTCTTVVIGSAGVPSVRSCIAVVELAHGDSAVEILKIPLAWDERRFSSESCFELHKKVSVVNPIPRLLKSLDAFWRVDVRGDRDRSFQRGFW